MDKGPLAKSTTTDTGSSSGTSFGGKNKSKLYFAPSPSPSPSLSGWEACKSRTVASAGGGSGKSSTKVRGPSGALTSIVFWLAPACRAALA
eukprot:7610317-Pyramimonas_sp.AAC.1